jgi:hypothetical protein
LEHLCGCVPIVPVEVPERFQCILGSGNVVDELDDVPALQVQDGNQGAFIL